MLTRTSKKSIGILRHKRIGVSNIPTVEDYKKKLLKTRPVFKAKHIKKKLNPQNPLVSIITVVRNGESTIERTIQSVLNQTYSNIEHIIVDGASRDKTLEIVARYQDKVSHCISEPDQGISDAFNKGIALAQGELVGILNSDDWYKENAVKLVVDEWQKHGEGIFHGKMKYWDHDKPYYLFEGRSDKLLENMTINHPTVFVSKSAYEKVGIFRNDFHIAMDYEFLRRAMLQNIKFVYLPCVITNMRLGGRSDQRWMAAYFETFKIRNLHNYPLLSNLLILQQAIFKTIVRKLLELFKLDKFVQIFRKKYSVVQKTRLEI